MWWFCHLWCASSWTTQNYDDPGDYWSNSRANLGRPPDFDWATGHLTWTCWVHHSWRFGHAEALHEVGPEIHERGSKNVNGASRLSNFWNFFGAISCRDWWPWMKPGYITMTQRQSNNQWRGGIVAHPAPKNSECKHSLEKFSPRFFGIKTASSSLVIIHRAKLSTRSITCLCWCKWRTFWSNKAAGETGLPGLPVSWSPTLFPGSGLVGLPPVLWTKKTIERSPFSSDAEVIAAAETWLDGQPSDFFFEWLVKVRATG